MRFAVQAEGSVAGPGVAPRLSVAAGVAASEASGEGITETLTAGALSAGLAGAEERRVLIRRRTTAFCRARKIAAIPRSRSTVVALKCMG
jgi:hypothetical protein